MTDVGSDLVRLELHRPETRFTRNGDFASVFDFASVLRKELPEDDFRDELDGEPTLLGPVVAYLTGFAYFPGYVPGEDGYESGDWDVFDARSAHTAQAYELLMTERERIGKVLGLFGGLDSLGGIVLYERGFVAPKFRGRRFLPLLMREMKHILEATGSLILLKAHPDGSDVTSADCRRLAKYYKSDKAMGLKPISSRQYPGWLVATCW